ncbi:hypothetical protein P692DRAFT_20723277 [Suillus brevipes Sb2]|nr:hypothetical protein P692DRAFT_20723277 [Suillus brevipes Sb2]
MPSTDSLRPRTKTGQAQTNVHLKTNWSAWEEGTQAEPPRIDIPTPASQNTTTPSSESSLSDLEDGEKDNSVIPFPELDVPELDLKLPWFGFKPRPRHSKTEPLSSIAAVPDYDLDKFFALALAAQPRTIMPTETPQIFHGDGRASENPADFLKSFNRAMRQQAVTQLSDKLDAYGDYLGTSSQAETWFKALSSADKLTWTAFVTAFEKR